MYKSEVYGKNGIVARVVAKSISKDNFKRVFTFEYEAPKAILAEPSTHGMLAKNAQSSRAVPIKKMIEQIRNNPVIPVHWGKNQAGMVAGGEINEVVKIKKHTFDEGEEGESMYLLRDVAWSQSAKVVADLMEAWEEAGYHKQIVNRLGEAFVMAKGVITATELDNFFHLRYHKDADPSIMELAKCMWEALEQAETTILKAGDKQIS